MVLIGVPWGGREVLLPGEGAGLPPDVSPVALGVRLVPRSLGEGRTFSEAGLAKGEASFPFAQATRVEPAAGIEPATR